MLWCNTGLQGFLLLFHVMIGQGNEFCNEKQCLLKSGLVFLKEDDILITGDKWTVVVNIYVQEYHTVISSARDAIRMLDVEAEKEATSDDLLMYVRSSEINRIRRIVDHLSSEIESFELMLPVESQVNNTRFKRGLINAGGILLKVLFGTLSDDDLVQLNTKISQIEGQSQVITHLVDELTVVKNIDQDVHSHGIILNETLDLLETVLENASQTNLSIWSELQLVEQALGKQHAVNSLMRELELSLLQVQKELLELRQSLEDTSAGKLSSLLVPPQNLSLIMQQVVGKLPTGLSLLTTTEIDQIYEYYHFVTVHAVSTITGICLSLDIPLKSPNRYFTLYSIQPIPFYDTLSDKYIVTKVQEDYLAVSYDRQRYVTMTHSDVNKCVRGLYTLCPLDLPVMLHSNSCVYHMFIGDEQLVQRYCEKFVISGQFEPFLYKIKETNDWIYSVSEPTRIVRKCSLAEPHSSETIQGLGILQNVQNCYVHSDKFVLLPSTSGTTNVDMNRTSIIIPVVSEIFDHEERQLLQKLSNVSSDKSKIHNLQQQLQATSTGVSIHDLAHEVEAAELQFGKTMSHRPADSTSFILMALVSILFLVTILTGVTMYHTRKIWRHNPSCEDGLQVDILQASTASPSCSMTQQTTPETPQVTVRYAKPGKVTI
ncbi:uncharacterized protein LOC120355274 [Nilaparvata lugens]|uniref:uncharacterized protein LOC120355274 n=1 Tax=Nilaparvata lugens TaxID=108931 RepID=UPI00193DFF04|nr:uncharacterized protein LOC120355274 [Nilaparvata lugens]